MKIVEEIHSLGNVLERKGYRSTSSRLRVLQVIADSGDQFTVEEVCSKIPDVGRATVYRTMKLLVSLGMVCKVVLQDGSPRYRLSRLIHHHHLVCASCGVMEDFARCTVDEVIQRVESSTNFQILGHRIELYGYCEACLTQGS